MTSLKAALIGTGFMFPIHAEALRRLQIPVVGVLASAPEKSRKAAEGLGIAKAYSNLTDLLSDDQVDVVHILTPNRLHFEMADAALRAGKHVMCEKPLAMTSAESAALTETARATRRAAGVCYNIRFYPLCLEAGVRMRQGDLGTIHSVQGSYVQDWLHKDTDYNWRVLSSEVGRLRAVADIGTHWMDLISYMSGLRVTEVLADFRTVHPIRRRPLGEVETFSGKLATFDDTEAIPVETEDCGTVMLRYENGALGSMWVSQVTAGRKNCLRFEVAGSRSTMAWNSELPNELWIGHRDRSNESLIRDPGLLSPLARTYTDYPGGHNEGYSDTFKQCFRAFYNSIDANDYVLTPQYPTFADGHQEIVLCEAILHSYSEGRWVEVPKYE